MDCVERQRAQILEARPTRGRAASGQAGSGLDAECCCAALGSGVAGCTRTVRGDQGRSVVVVVVIIIIIIIIL